MTFYTCTLANMVVRYRIYIISSNFRISKCSLRWSPHSVYIAKLDSDPDREPGPKGRSQRQFALLPGGEHRDLAVADHVLRAHAEVWELA